MRQPRARWREIAREGGLGSVFWAGGKNLTEDGSFDPKFRTDGFRKGEKQRLSLEARLDFDQLTFAYGLELGFGNPQYDAVFAGEAQIKEERLELVGGKRRTVVLERSGPTIWARNAEGKRETLDAKVLASETALTNVGGAFPEVALVRQNWLTGGTSRRISHRRRVGAAPSFACDHLAATGLGRSNLAAVFATLRHIRQDGRSRRGGRPRLSRCHARRALSRRVRALRCDLSRYAQAEFSGA